MSYLTQLLEPRSLESDTPINNTTLGAILGGYTATTGKSVNVTTAMQLVAVYACIRLISEAVATLPLHLYRRLEQGKERAPEHSLYPVLHDIPNPEMTSVELRETVQAHMLLWGVGYCEVVRNGAGQVKQLWPIIPTRVRPFRNTRNELVYRVTLPDNHFQTLRADRILRMSALLGLSPIGQAREALGLTMAAEEYGARFFANDSRPGGLLEHPGQLSTEASARLRNSWEESQKGLTNAHRIAILEEGLKWVQVGIAPEDAQFLETRKYQLDEIARLYHVPPHMIGDLDRATWANIEHLSIDFVVNTLRPWLVRWEQAIHKTLLVESMTDAFYLNWFSTRLNEKGRAGLDSSWKIVPCGGGEKIGAFLGLFGANQGDVVVLMDVTGGQKLQESELLRGCGILTMDKYINNEEGSIEDLIGWPTYFGLVNLCYKLPRKKRLSLKAPGETVSTEGQPKRLVRQVEEHFAAAGPDVGSFDRYKPAEFLVEHTGKCLKKLPDLSRALDRFEGLFADINTCQTSRQALKAPDYTQARPIVDLEPRKKAGRLTEAEKV